MKRSLTSIIVFLLLFVSHNLVAITYIPLPQDINDLVSTSDLIVIATIGKVLDKRQFYGYQENADFLAAKDKETPFPLGIPIVDFAVEVKEIIQDDKDFPRLNNENSIILRTFQNHENLFSSIAMKERSGSMILFLTRNPDDKTYGLYSAMHKVMFNNLDEEMSYFLNGIDYVIHFAEQVTARDFISQIKKHVNARK